MYDTLRKIWVPATVIHVLPWDSYQGCTSNGSTYHHMQRHLCEHSVKVVNTDPSDTTATLQAPTRHHFSVAQPASAPPVQCMLPTSTAPATLSTQMNQTPTVPAMPAVQRNALAPMPVTSHATPVQPPRSGHACMAHRSRKSRNFSPRLCTDLVTVTCCCPHPQSFIRVNCSVSYSQKGGCCMIVFCFKNCSPLCQSIGLAVNSPYI